MTPDDIMPRFHLPLDGGLDDLPLRASTEDLRSFNVLIGIHGISNPAEWVAL